MFWILHGEDEFRRSEFLSELKKEFGDPATLEVNTTLLDGRRVSLDEIVHAAGAVPFLGDRRLVIVEGLLTRLLPAGRGRGKTKQSEPKSAAQPRQGGETESKDEGTFLQGLKSALGRMPDSTVLVFNEPSSLPTQHPFMRTLLQEPAGAGGIQEFRPFSASRRDGPGQLRRWITERARGKKVRLTPEATEALAVYVGYDLRLLDQELEKLATYSGGDGRTVTDVDVRTLVPYVREADVFEMVDALGRRDIRTAVVLLHRMLDEGKAPLYILTMIARQFRLMIQVKELHASGFALEECARELKLHEFVVKKTLSQAHGFTFPQLEAAYASCADFDAAIKTGLMTEVLALDMLVADLCGG